MRTWARKEIEALITLAELPDVGWQRLTQIIAGAQRRKVPLIAVPYLPPKVLRGVFRLPSRTIERLHGQAAAHRDHCDRLRTQLGKAGVRTRAVDGSGYPTRWVARFATPPPLLHTYGTPQVIEAPTIAILNSREITERAVSAIVRIVQQAAAEGFAVVCGGMKTMHRITAVAARAAAAPRVLVLDRGILAVAGHDLARDPFGFGPGRAPLDASRTLVLSPFRPTDHAAASGGRLRDRLIATLADVTIAVDARPGGEIERTCLATLDRGLCVCSWEGRNDTLMTAGALAVGTSELKNGLADLAWEHESRMRETVTPHSRENSQP